MSMQLDLDGKHIIMINLVQMHPSLAQKLSISIARSRK